MTARIHTKLPTEAPNQAIFSSESVDTRKIDAIYSFASFFFYQKGPGSVLKTAFLFSFKKSSTAPHLI